MKSTHVENILYKIYLWQSRYKMKHWIWLCAWSCLFIFCWYVYCVRIFLIYHKKMTVTPSSHLFNFLGYQNFTNTLGIVSLSLFWRQFFTTLSANLTLRVNGTIQGWSVGIKLINWTLMFKRIIHPKSEIFISHTNYFTIRDCFAARLV